METAGRQRIRSSSCGLGRVYRDSDANAGDCLGRQAVMHYALKRSCGGGAAGLSTPSVGILVVAS